MNRLPIRGRVTAAFALAMAIVLAATGSYLYVRLSSHLSLALDRQLQQRAQDLAALVTQPNATLARGGDGQLVEQGESYAELIDSRGRVVDATRTLGHRPLLSGSELAAARQHTVYLDRASTPGLDEPSRALATVVLRDGRRFVLIVGSTSQNNAETLHSFRTELFVSGPVALLLASLVGYLLAGLSLRQVESMRLRAATISAERPGERLPVPPTGDELERLGRTLNEMLGRLEGAIERERDFVADAGHELRTPLAVLRTELELALRQASTAEELREAVRLSSLEADRLSQLAEGLLLIARADRGTISLRVEEIDVGELLRGVASRFEWRAQQDGGSIRVAPTGGATLRGDRLRLEQALGNLVDNALRHGGHAVRLETTARDGDVGLHVVDDGPGFPADFLGEAFERFTRADQARGGGGAGLGLSIVRAIAASHKGTAGAANGPNGTDVWLLVPAA